MQQKGKSQPVCTGPGEQPKGAKSTKLFTREAFAEGETERGPEIGAACWVVCGVPSRGTEEHARVKPAGNDSAAGALEGSPNELCRRPAFCVRAQHN